MLRQQVVGREKVASGILCRVEVNLGRVLCHRSPVRDHDAIFPVA